MFRCSLVQLETWRALYHRYRTPRQSALQRYIVATERKLQKKQQEQQKFGSAAAAAAASSSSSSSSSKRSHITASAPDVSDYLSNKNVDHGVPHKYNRFWVNDEWNFVAQHAFTEDPDVVARRRAMLPEPTETSLWKQPRTPYFEPFSPFLRIVDYAKDPDAKYMKPTNVPRWKEFMMRNKPVVPRTWY